LHQSITATNERLEKKQLAKIDKTILSNLAELSKSDSKQHHYIKYQTQTLLYIN